MARPCGPRVRGWGRCGPRRHLPSTGRSAARPPQPAGHDAVVAGARGHPRTGCVRVVRSPAGDTCPSAAHPAGAGGPGDRGGPASGRRRRCRAGLPGAAVPVGRPGGRRPRDPACGRRRHPADLPGRHARGAGQWDGRAAAPPGRGGVGPDEHAGAVGCQRTGHHGGCRVARRRRDRRGGRPVLAGPDRLGDPVAGPDDLVLRGRGVARAGTPCCSCPRTCGWRTSP